MIGVIFEKEFDDERFKAMPLGEFRVTAQIGTGGVAARDHLDRDHLTALHDHVGIAEALDEVSWHVIAHQQGEDVSGGCTAQGAFAGDDVASSAIAGGDRIFADDHRPIRIGGVGKDLFGFAFGKECAVCHA